jgi:hypothetical protein
MIYRKSVHYGFMLSLRMSFVLGDQDVILGRLCPYYIILNLNRAEGMEKCRMIIRTASFTKHAFGPINDGTPIWGQGRCKCLPEWMLLERESPDGHHTHVIDGNDALRRSDGLLYFAKQKVERDHWGYQPTVEWLNFQYGAVTSQVNHVKRSDISSASKCWRAANKHIPLLAETDAPVTSVYNKTMLDALDAVALAKPLHLQKVLIEIFTNMPQACEVALPMLHKLREAASTGSANGLAAEAPSIQEGDEITVPPPGLAEPQPTPSETNRSVPDSTVNGTSGRSRPPPQPKTHAHCSELPRPTGRPAQQPMAQPVVPPPWNKGAPSHYQNTPQPPNHQVRATALPPDTQTMSYPPFSGPPVHAVHPHQHNMQQPTAEHRPDVDLVSYAPGPTPLQYSYPPAAAPTYQSSCAPIRAPTNGSQNGTPHQSFYAPAHMPTHQTPNVPAYGPASRVQNTVTPRHSNSPSAHDPLGTILNSRPPWSQAMSLRDTDEASKSPPEENKDDKILLKLKLELMDEDHT